MIQVTYILEKVLAAIFERSLTHTAERNVIAAKYALKEMLEQAKVFSQTFILNCYCKLINLQRK